jgi:quercetin dioxygenase-like cupin family protein
LFLVEEISMSVMDRRAFTALLPALVSAVCLLPDSAEAQQAAGAMGQAGAPKGPLPILESGVFPPSAVSNPTAPRRAEHYLNGMLKAGNIQMEIHSTQQEPGTPHEAIGHHLHSEIWLVREGVCELMTNGVTRRMVAGDVGLCCAGDEHWVRNAGDTACSYFVVTVGPPEPR